MCLKITLEQKSRSFPSEVFSLLDSFFSQLGKLHSSDLTSVLCTNTVWVSLKFAMKVSHGALFSQHISSSLETLHNSASSGHAKRWVNAVDLSPDLIMDINACWKNSLQTLCWPLVFLRFLLVMNKQVALKLNESIFQLIF